MLFVALAGRRWSGGIFGQSQPTHLGQDGCRSATGGTIGGGFIRHDDFGRTVYSTRRGDLKADEKSLTSLQ